LSEALNDSYSIASVLTNLGVIYKDQGRLELALETQEKARQVFQNMDHGRGLMAAHHNIAVIYYKMGQLNTAEEYIQYSNEIAKRLNSKYVLLVNDILLSRICLERGSIKEAISLAIQVIPGTEELGLLTEKHETLELLSQIYIADGRADLALETMINSNILKDSIFNLEKGRQMLELQTKYETAQKESVIELLNKEKALQKSELSRKTLQQNMILGGIALLSLVGFIAFRSYTFRQKQKQLLLDEQLKNERIEAERLQELDEAKSRFFANIAHEFRTPLTLILGPSEQIIQESSATQIVDNAQMIRQNASKLLTLTNQLLDLSKLESGMIKLQPVHADFISFTKGCVFAFESLADEKEIAIHFQSVYEKLLMDFDEEKAAIMINNLMSNALKFTPPFGKVRVEVKSAALSGGEEFIELIIADTGIGIAAEQLPFIFDRFFQADDSLSRRNQGTGIGLALTKELAELHRGTIVAVSTPGTGTTFTVTLPTAQENVITAEREPRKNLSSESSLWLNDPVEKNDLSIASTANDAKAEDYTVLVVEDNPEVRNFIVGVLGNYYQVIEADNGQTGLEKTTELVPDLVITDLMMPVMDGYQYCRRVKEDERTSHIPVIMLTAKDSLDHKVDGFETGVDDYLTKPFHARELLARIKNLIKSRNALHEKYGKLKDPALFEKKEHAFITKLKQIIDENIDQETFNVVDLGRSLAMSRTQVHRKLKALTNLSTSQFIRNHKLTKAMDLLQSGSYNVSEVAYMLGFNTPNYFSTCFNEYFGFPPSEAGRASKSNK
jgi:signal transduction histidine kinase/DNA-binding response OmpR family regulator